MENTKRVAEKLKVVPKLKLGVKLEKGGVQSTGPHLVTFLEDMIVNGRDDLGKPRQEIRFTVEESGIKYRWNIPILGKDGNPHYLVEKLMNIEPGQMRILEMKKFGAKNFVDVREPGAVSEAPENVNDDLAAYQKAFSDKSKK